MLYALQTFSLIYVLHVQALKAMQGSQHACQLIEQGVYNGHEYIIMELLGYNAVELRKAQAPSGRWGTHMVKQLGACPGHVFHALQHRFCCCAVLKLSLTCLPQLGCQHIRIVSCITV